MEKKVTLPTVDDVEQLTTRELADFLANVVVVLRRMPDVPLVALQAEDRSGVWADHARQVVENIRGEKEKPSPRAEDLPDWTKE
jgi:hypothetical protein